MTFINPFFSIAGQVERIKNVGAVFNIGLNPFHDKEDVIQANIGNPTVKAIVEKASTYPLGTAFVLATAVNPINAVKTATYLAPKLVPATTKGKVIAGTVAFITAGSLYRNPTGTISTIANAPNSLGTLSGDTTDFIANPSLEKAQKIYTDNPVLASTIGITLTAGALYFGGRALGPLLTRKTTVNIDNPSGTGNPASNVGLTNPSTEGGITQNFFMQPQPTSPIAESPTTIPKVTKKKTIKKKAKKKKRKVVKKKKHTKKKKKR